MEDEYEYDPVLPLPWVRNKENAVEEYFEVESMYMAAPDYSRSTKRFLRKRAVQLIFISSKSDDFVISYLAMNYFDRFISSNPLPVVGNDLRSSFDLLVISCLTLAWKMRDRDFSLSDFLRERNLPQINQANVEEMENLIRTGLGGRLSPVTPYCFVDYFLSKVGIPLNRKVIGETIIESQGRVEFTQFKPSVIAAAAIIMSALIKRTQDLPATITKLYTDNKLDRAKLHLCRGFASALFTDHKIGCEDDASLTPSKAETQQQKPRGKGKKWLKARGKGKGFLETIKEEPQPQAGEVRTTAPLKWLTEDEEKNEVTIDPNLLLQFVALPPPGDDHQESASSDIASAKGAETQGKRDKAEGSEAQEKKDKAEGTETEGKRDKAEGTETEGRRDKAKETETQGKRDTGKGKKTRGKRDKGKGKETQGKRDEAEATETCCRSL